jgi:hypothetical protein
MESLEGRELCDRTAASGGVFPVSLTVTSREVVTVAAATAGAQQPSGIIAILIG